MAVKRICADVPPGTLPVVTRLRAISPRRGLPPDGQLAYAATLGAVVIACHELLTPFAASHAATSYELAAAGVAKPNAIAIRATQSDQPAVAARPSIRLVVMRPVIRRRTPRHRRRTS